MATRTVTLPERELKRREWAAEAAAAQKALVDGSPALDKEIDKAQKGYAVATAALREAEAKVMEAQRTRMSYRYSYESAIEKAQGNLARTAPASIGVFRVWIEAALEASRKASVPRAVPGDVEGFKSCQAYRERRDAHLQRLVDARGWAEKLALQGLSDGEIQSALDDMRAQLERGARYGD
jgi:hypothetical protein